MNHVQRRISVCPCRRGIAYTAAIFFGLGFGCTPPPGPYAGPSPGGYYAQPNAYAQPNPYAQPAPYTGVNLGPMVQNGLLAGTSAAATGHHWIKKNIDHGAVIQLDDNSLWLVDHIDRITTSLWLATEDVVLTDDGADYLLVNTLSKESVRVSALRSSP